MARPRSLARLTLLSTVACVPFGCSPMDGSAPPVTRVDSAGLEIVTSTGPAWEEGQGWTISPEPVLNIGVVDGEDPYQFFRVSDVMRLDDGRVVVANGGTREVRLFDAEGRFIRTVGGAGQGPGEFRYPSGLLLRPEGGFRVIDFMDLEHFDGEGGHVRVEGFDRARFSELMGPLGPSEGGTPMGDGRVLTPIYGSGFFNQGEPRPGPPYRPEITVAMVEPGSGVIDTLAQIGGTKQQFVDVGTRTTSIVHPYAPSGRWFSGRDGSVVIYDGAVPEVHRIGPDGTHRILRWVAEPEPITDAEFEAWKEQQRSASWAQDRLPELERGWAGMDLPTTKAMVTDARPSLDGSTWVRTDLSAYEASGPAEWRIFATDGVWLGSVELPAGFTPHEISAAYVLGVHRDPATEIETVRMYAVDKGGA